MSNPAGFAVSYRTACITYVNLVEVREILLIPLKQYLKKFWQFKRKYKEVVKNFSNIKNFSRKNTWVKF